MLPRETYPKANQKIKKFIMKSQSMGRKWFKPNNLAEDELNKIIYGHAWFEYFLSFLI